nr:retrovirus-related Pol polyprotein from transposon TNT 1-94 [Tanacetum cinerariifolium]
MIGNKCYLTDFEAFDGGIVSFRDGKGRISGKGKIKIGKLDFDDVYFCKELNYNLFSVSQMCDKKNNVLLTDIKCLVLSSNFNLLDESQLLLRVPRKDNIYSVDLKSVVPTGEAVNIACYVVNRALVTKPNNKTPYELIRGRPPLIDFMKPFGCPITILNTRDNLGKFEGKADEGHFVGYSVVSKAMRVFDKRKKIVEDSLNIRFQENVANELKKTLLQVKMKRRKNLNKKDAEKKAPEVDSSEASDNVGQDNQVSRSEDGSLFQEDRQTEHNNSTNDINTISSPVSTAGPSFVNATPQIPLNAIGPSANDTGIFGNAYDDDVLEKEVNMNNVDSSYAIPKATKKSFSSKLWTLVDLPKDKWAIGTKWVYRNKKDERGIVIKNKAILVAQGHTQEEGMDYNEVFAAVAMIEAIRLFLAYASFKDFIVYQMDVKSVLLYGKIEEEVYVCQPLGFEDPNFPNKVYKVEKALYGLHQAPRALMIAKDGRCFVDTSKVTTGNTLLSTVGLTTAGQMTINESMRIIRAGFSGVVTPLIDTMMVQVVADVGDTPIETHLTFIVDQPSTSRPQKKQKPKTKQRKEAELSLDESEDADNVPTPSSDPLPSGADSYTLHELMVFYTRLQEQLFDLQEAKDAQSKEIAALKKKVSKLLKWRKSRFGGLRRLMKTCSDADTQGRKTDDEMFRVDDLTGEEVVTTVADKVSAAPKTYVTEDEITMAQALAALKSVKPTILAAVLKVTTDVPTPRSKGYARQLKAKEQEAARLSRAQQDEEANISWENTQAMMVADSLLAGRLQAREKEEFSEVQKARLLVELIEKRKKHFAALSA